MMLPSSLMMMLTVPMTLTSLDTTTPDHLNHHVRRHVSSRLRLNVPSQLWINVASGLQ
jgi:hypothetical protein